MRIECASFPTPWHEVSMRSELQASDDRRLYLAAEIEGELAGYIGAHFYADEVHIGTLAVAPGHRRCGIGELLLLQMLKTAIKREICYATLEYRADNKPAQKLYEKAGFESVRVRKGYYRDTGEDAIVVAIDDLDTEARKQAIQRLYEEAKERQQHDIYVEC